MPAGLPHARSTAAGRVGRAPGCWASLHRILTAKSSNRLLRDSLVWSSRWRGAARRQHGGGSGGGSDGGGAFAAAAPAALSLHSACANSAADSLSRLQGAAVEARLVFRGRVAPLEASRPAIRAATSVFMCAGVAYFVGGVYGTMCRMLLAAAVRRRLPGRALRWRRLHAPCCCCSLLVSPCFSLEHAQSELPNPLTPHPTRDA